jgi:ATP-dependent RNA helicase DDX10/DBP4
VLDEADRILDLGFASTLNAIVANLPDTRQTLLFSATQTKSIKDLARLSLHDSEYVQVSSKQPVASTSADNGDAQLETPDQLEHHYMVVPLPSKLDQLWAFIKLHLYQKSIVFASSCKQVRFIYESFRHMQPGVVLLHLHGKMKQGTRLEVFQRFGEAKHACLIATDIAARGLDFPAVDWVVQLDAPEDVDTYVHRVGRTARYTAKGKALLFLLPSEEQGFLARLEKKGIKVGKLNVKNSKQVATAPRIQSLAFKFTDLKFLSQKAFISYVRSIYLQKDKTVFKFDELPLEEYALSLGLAGAPHIKFSKMPSKEQALAKKNAARTVEALQEVASAESSSEEEEETENVFGRKTAGMALDGDDAPREKLSKKDRVFKRQNPTILAEHYANLVERDEDDDADDFITLKRVNHTLEDDGDDEPLITEQSKRALRAGTSKKAAAAKRGQGQKLLFDEDGEAHALYEFQSEADFAAKGAANDQNAAFVKGELSKMQEVDVVDKERVKERKREKKRKRKEREVRPVCWPSGHSDGCSPLYR